MTLIKICGITNPELAYESAKNGADMIGIVRYPKSKRHVSSLIAKEISAAANEGGAIPVLVFKDSDAHEIMESCKNIDVDTVQLHGIHVKLTDSIKLILANTDPSLLRKNMDFLLFDNSEPGCGILLDWSRIIPPAGVNWFLSGGLTPENVGEGIQFLKPTGVDVSTGVEINGIKDKHLIKNFIDRVRSYE